MASVNRVELIGYAGSDPEVKNFENGGSLVRLSFATTDSYMDKKGDKIESTEWHKLIFRSNQAKYVEQNVKKGYQLFIEGRLKTRSFDDKDNKKIYVTEIHVYNVQILGSKAKADNVPEGQEY